MFLTNREFPEEIDHSVISPVNMAVGDLRRRLVASRKLAKAVLDGSAPLKVSEMQDRFNRWLQGNAPETVRLLLGEQREMPRRVASGKNRASGCNEVPTMTQLTTGGCRAKLSISTPRRISPFVGLRRGFAFCPLASASGAARIRRRCAC